MKQFVFPLLLSAFLLGSGLQTAHAQRGTVSKTVRTTKLVGIQEEYNQTESFRLTPAYEMLVTPMVAEVNVLSQEKRTFSGSARTDRPEGLAANQYLINKTNSTIELERAFEIIKSEVIYDFCAEYRADVIALPQFKIQQVLTEETDADGNTLLVPLEIRGKYVVTVQATGFPAIYKNFRTGTADDRWIKETLQAGKTSNEDTKYRTVESNTRVR